MYRCAHDRRGHDHDKARAHREPEDEGNFRQTLGNEEESVHSEPMRDISSDQGFAICSDRVPLNSRSIDSLGYQMQRLH